jgi:hypothetical protein
MLVTDEQAEESLVWLEENIDASVKARADFDHLDEFSKTVLAELTINETAGMSVKAADSHARAHEKYRNHRKMVDTANRARLKMEYLRRFHELRTDLWRTCTASARLIR